MCRYEFLSYLILIGFAVKSLDLMTSLLAEVSLFSRKNYLSSRLQMMGGHLLCRSGLPSLKLSDTSNSQTYKFILIEKSKLCYTEIFSNL